MAGNDCQEKNGKTEFSAALEKRELDNECGIYDTTMQKMREG